MALICKTNPQQCLLFSHCSISLVYTSELVVGFSWRDSGQMGMSWYISGVCSWVRNRWCLFRMRFSCTTCHKVGSLGPRWTCVLTGVCRRFVQCFVPVPVASFGRVCVFNVCVLSPWWLMACCPAGWRKARRRRCLLFHQVAIATVHLGAAIISLITMQLSWQSPPPTHTPISSLCYPCTAG